MESKERLLLILLRMLPTNASKRSALRLYRIKNWLQTPLYAACYLQWKGVQFKLGWRCKLIFLVVENVLAFLGCFAKMIYILKFVPFKLKKVTRQKKCFFLSDFLCQQKAVTNRGSHRTCSIKKGVLKNFGKFTGKHLFQSSFFNKVAGLSLQLYQIRDSDTGGFRWIL